MQHTDFTPSKTHFWQLALIQLDKLRFGSRHRMHQWGRFRVRYRDGSQSRRQSWAAAKQLSATHGGQIYHIATNTPITVSNNDIAPLALATGLHH